MKPKKLPPSVEVEKTDPLSESLRTKLLEIVNRRPMTPVALLELEQTARLAREILAVGKNPEARPRKKSSSFLSMPDPYSGGGDSMDDALTLSPPIETFGANAVRELVAALPALLPKPPAPEQPTMTQQVMAIAYARERGLTDLAVQLESKMLGTVSKEHPVLAAVRAEMVEETFEKLKKHSNGKAKVTS